MVVAVLAGCEGREKHLGGTGQAVVVLRISITQGEEEKRKEEGEELRIVHRGFGGVERKEREVEEKKERWVVLCCWGSLRVPSFSVDFFVSLQAHWGSSSFFCVFTDTSIAPWERVQIPFIQRIHMYLHP